jgi:hypothetical protein
MNDNDPYYISEHRKSYDNTEELLDTVHEGEVDFTIFPISITRFEIAELLQLAKQENIKLNVFHQFILKPLNIKESWILSLNNSKYGGLVTDDDYVEGISDSIANNLNLATGKKVHTLGLEPRTAGFYPSVDNLPPTAEKMITLLKKIKNG